VSCHENPAVLTASHLIVYHSLVPFINIAIGNNNKQLL